MKRQILIEKKTFSSLLNFNSAFFKWALEMDFTACDVFFGLSLKFKDNTICVVHPLF